MIDKIHQLGCVEGLSMLEAHSAALIICDPPYYQVKGEFDKAWGRDFRSYLKDVRRWAEACRRVLSDTGTLMWYGSWRSIAYTQVILDEMFHLVNSCVLVKKNGIQHKFASVKQARGLFVNDERLLIYEAVPEANADGVKDAYRYSVGLARSRAFKPLIDYLRDLQSRGGKSVAAINKGLGTCMANHWFTDRSQWEMPTEAAYGRLVKFLGVDARPFAEVKAEYDRLNAVWAGGAGAAQSASLRRFFRMPAERVYDVIPFCSAASYEVNLYGHPTTKDLRVTEDLIRMTTRPGDLVVVPFAGSGTECHAAAALGRRFIGFDVEAQYVDTANRRVRHAERKLF